MNNLGAAHGSLRDCSRAIEAFQEALRRKPDYTEAWCNLDIAYRNEGRKVEAETIFRRLLVSDTAIAGTCYNRVLAPR